MGRLIKTNFKDSFQLESTISEDVIAEFETKQELLNFLAKEHIYNGKLKAIEVLIRGFDQYNVNDEFYLEENREHDLDSYYQWLDKISEESKTYEEYWNEIDKKLNELLKD